MRFLRLLSPLLVVAVVLVAGCAELRGRIEADPAPAYGTILPWSATDCRFAIAIVPVDPSAFSARVPEGFRVLAVGEIPGFPEQGDPRAQGNLGVQVFRCAAGTGANDTANLTDLAYGTVFSFVEPPEARHDANATHHVLKWDVLIPDEARRALLAAEGVPAVAGNATFARFQAAGPLAGAQALLQLGPANYSLDAAGASGRADAFARASLLEFSPARGDALVEWRANLTATQAQGGLGFLDLSEAAEWVRAAAGGSARTQAYLVTGAGSLENGTIALPWRG